MATQKYNFAEVKLQYEHDSDIITDIVALKSMDNLGIKEDSYEDDMVAYYFESYEDFLESMLPNTKQTIHIIEVLDLFDTL